MIRKAELDMLPRLRRIWQTCFGDNDKATELVFNHLLGPDQMLVKTDGNGRPIAMVNWKLLRFTTPRQTFAGAYLYGIGTLPEHRGKGVSTALMEETRRLLAGEGVKLACLVPASRELFDFYAARGFETRFHYKKLRLSRAEIPAPAAQGVLSAAALQDLEALRNAFFGPRALFGAWDADYLRYTGRECRFYGGEALLFSSGGRQGYAVCYPLKDLLLVKEAAILPQDIGVLLAALDARYKAGRYELRLPADFETGGGWPTETLPFAMTTWYDKSNQPGTGLGGAPWFAFGLDGP